MGVAAQRTPYAWRAAMQGEGKVELVRDWVALEASLTALIALRGMLRGRVMYQVRRFVLYATPLACGASPAGAQCKSGSLTP